MVARPSHGTWFVPLVAAAFAPMHAGAGIVAYYNGPTSFSAAITGMPDLDQFRDSLLPDGNGNGGGMYCVPTSCVNLFAYAANNGFPSLMPGPGNWQAQSSYAIASLAIAVTASQMGTDPVNGTNGGGSIAGATAILATGAKDQLCVQWIFSSAQQKWVRVHDIAKQVALGGIATLAYGRYTVTGNSSGTYVLALDEKGDLDRNGGHAVTFESASPSGPFADYALTVRDPATPDVPDAMQSAFESRYTDVYSLTLRGGALTFLRVIGPHDALRGRAITYRVQALDAWMNPAHLHRVARLSISAPADERCIDPLLQQPLDLKSNTQELPEILAWLCALLDETNERALRVLNMALSHSFKDPSNQRTAG